MTYRIEWSEAVEGVVVRVVGRLVADGASELQELCGRRREPVRVDLRELVSADAAAIAGLRALRDRGTCLLNTSPYIRLLLNDVAGGDTPPTRRDPNMEE